MKRVVADTNVLLSALQFGGKPKQLLDLAIDGQVGDGEVFGEMIDGLPFTRTSKLTQPRSGRAH